MLLKILAIKDRVELPPDRPFVQQVQLPEGDQALELRVGLHFRVGDRLEEGPPEVAGRALQVGGVVDAGRGAGDDGCVDVCPTNCLKQVPLTKLNLDLGEGNLRRAVDNFYGIDSKEVEEEELAQVGTAMLKNEDLCIRCGLCAEKCPTQAVTMDMMNYAFRWIG